MATKSRSGNRKEKVMLSSKTHQRCVLVAAYLLLAAVILASVPVHADELVSVSGASAPWQYVNGGLNTNYQYGLFDDTTQMPTVVAANPGDPLTLTYVSGTWSSGSVVCDAGGGIYPYGPSTFTSPSEFENLTGWGSAPGYWCPADEFPMNFLNLIGVFTDASGSIIGTPHAINDACTLIVPNGATQLQLGSDDPACFDNGGAVTMSITGSSTPEPSTIVLLGIGAVSMMAYAWRKRRRTA